MRESRVTDGRISRLEPAQVTGLKALVAVLLVIMITSGLELRELRHELEESQAETAAAASCFRTANRKLDEINIAAHESAWDDHASLLEFMRSYQPIKCHADE